MVHTLPEEERHLLEMVESFVATTLRPRAHVVDEASAIPDDLLEAITAMDLWGLAMPSASGGSDRSTRTALLVIEELSRGLPAVGVLAAAHDVAGWLLTQGPGAEELVADVHHGRRLATAGITALATTNLWCQSHTPGSRHVLTGATPPMPGAAHADIILVTARCGAGGQDDLVVVAIDQHEQRIEPDPVQAMTGLRGSGSCSLQFAGDVIEPHQVIIDEPGAGTRAVRTARSRFRIAMAAVAVGLAQAGLDGTRIHARTAIEDGRRLHDHPDVAATLADMASTIEAARALQRSAADRSDHRVGTVRVAAMARQVATRSALDVITDGITLHGAAGPATSFPMERLLRDAVTLATVLDTDRELTRDIATSLVPE